MKETYLIIGTDSEEDIQRVMAKGKDVGIKCEPIFKFCHNNTSSFYNEAYPYKMGIKSILDEKNIGVVKFTSNIFKTSSAELDFWTYMELLAKGMGKKIVRESELWSRSSLKDRESKDSLNRLYGTRCCEILDDLKNPGKDVVDSLNKIRKLWEDAISSQLIKEKAEPIHDKNYSSDPLGPYYSHHDDPRNLIREHIWHDIDETDGSCIYPISPIGIRIDISVRGRDRSGDDLRRHGDSRDTCPGGSGKPGTGRDEACGGCCSEPSGQ